MSGFINFFLHFVFIAIFVFLIIVSFIILRPFRIHRTRMVSTLALKLSYLLYLVVFIALVYLILFFSVIPEEEELLTDDWIMNLCYAIIVISFFVPNLAIMLRRKVKKLRQQYNVFFTVVNVFIVLALLFVIKYFPFQF